MIKAQRKTLSSHKNSALSPTKQHKPLQLRSAIKTDYKQNNNYSKTKDGGISGILQQKNQNCGYKYQSKCQNDWRPQRPTYTKQAVNNQNQIKQSHIQTQQPLKTTQPNKYSINYPKNPSKSYLNQTFSYNNNRLSKCTQKYEISQLLNQSYRYEHNNSTQAQQFIASSCMKNKQRQVEYKIQSQHIQNMHKDISVMLNIIKDKKKCINESVGKRFDRSNRYEKAVQVNGQRQAQNSKLRQKQRQMYRQVQIQKQIKLQKQKPFRYTQQVNQPPKNYYQISQFQIEDTQYNKIQQQKQHQRQLEQQIMNKINSQHKNIKIAKINIPSQNQQYHSKQNRNSYPYQYPYADTNIYNANLNTNKMQQSQVEPFLKDQTYQQFQITLHSHNHNNNNNNNNNNSIQQSNSISHNLSQNSKFYDLKQYDKEIYQDYLKKYRELTHQNTSLHSQYGSRDYKIQADYKSPKYIQKPFYNSKQQQQTYNCKTNANNNTNTNTNSNNNSKYKYTDQQNQQKQYKQTLYEPNKYNTNQSQNQKCKHIQNQINKMQQIEQQDIQIQQQASSQYVQFIDKQIQKIRDRIYDSQKITKQMQDKYLLNATNNYSHNNIINNNITSKQINTNDNRKQILLGDFKNSLNIMATIPSTTLSLNQKYLSPYDRIKIQSNKNSKIYANQLNTTNIDKKYQNKLANQNKIKNTTIQKQSHRYRPQTQSKSSIYQKIISTFAKKWAEQIDLDIQLRVWREKLKDYQGKIDQKKIKKNGRCNDNIDIWDMLVNKLKLLGFVYTKEQLHQILQITSNQFNPFQQQNITSINKYPTSNTSQTQYQLIQNLCKTFIASQNHWYTQATSFINLTQAKTCNFTASAIDLNKKGYISIQDIVCFINLYGGKFYRNRDIVMLIKRIWRDLQNRTLNEDNFMNNKIQYCNIEGIIFRHM